jgi:hypothetical protein
MAVDIGTDVPSQLALTINPLVLVQAGGERDTVVVDDDSFRVTVRWSVTPQPAAVLLTGTWTVCVYVESVGPGPERLLGSSTVPADGGPEYATVLRMAPGTLPSNADPATASGVYKVFAVLTYATSLNAPTEITAFSEGPHFLIRTP